MTLGIIIKLKTKTEAAEQVLTTIHGRVSNRDEDQGEQEHRTFPRSLSTLGTLLGTLSFILPAPLQEVHDTA